jgi:hypothetical protein
MSHSSTRRSVPRAPSGITAGMKYVVLIYSNPASRAIWESLSEQEGPQNF